MKIDLLNIDDFVVKHLCKEVTNPVYFNLGNTPTADGLFSFDIFGTVGSNERKFVFGYINLKRKFLHPSIYKLFTNMNKKLVDLLTAKKYFIVKDGELVEDSEKGKTGITYFKSIYKQLKWKDTGSQRRNTYLSLLNKLTDDDIFISKWLVEPAFLRDYKPDATGRDVMAVDTINESYSKLIRLCNSIREGENYDFMNAIAESNIQAVINEIYEYLIQMIPAKNGLLHKALLGKAVDYCTRSVITTPSFGNKWDTDSIRFGYSNIPLSQVVICFYPFFVKYIQDYVIEREQEFSIVEDEKGNEISIPDVKEQFSENNIKKLMSLYIKSVENRFKAITVKDKNGKEYPVNLYKKDLNRSFTITDLLFIAATDITRDKHVYITRYPVESNMNIFPSRINVMSTVETKPQKLEDRYLPNYPIIYPNYPCNESMFQDSVSMHNSVLQALGEKILKVVA